MATAYTHAKKSVMRHNFKRVTDIAAAVLRKGEVYVYSPITHGHPINHSEPNWSYWKDLDEYLLSMCDELWIAEESDWKNSVGVLAEIAWAKNNDMPIKYVKLNRGKIELQ